MSAFVSAVIVAAGGSARMGIADSKQFIPLLSRPAIEYTLKAFQKCHLIKEIVIVCREQDNDRINKIIELNGFSKVSKLVKGGDSRAEKCVHNCVNKHIGIRMTEKSEFKGNLCTADYQPSVLGKFMHIISVTDSHINLLCTINPAVLT